MPDVWHGETENALYHGIDKLEFMGIEKHNMAVTCQAENNKKIYIYWAIELRTLVPLNMLTVLEAPSPETLTS